MAKGSLKYIVIGSGGHANALLSALNKDQKNQIVGYADKYENNSFSKQFRYLGNDNDIARDYSPISTQMILGLSYVGKKIDLEMRKRVISFYESRNFSFLSIISRSSNLSVLSTIGKGVFIAPGTSIIANAIISNYCSINTGAIIEHDTLLHNNVQVSPGCIICGGVVIGQNSFIGAGSIIRDGVFISENTIIGMGSIVTKNIDEPGVYFGNPLKKVL